jgi:hypothetical protein
MGIITRGQAWLGHYSYTRFERDGTEKEVRVPPVAQTYTAFQGFCRKEELATGTASC